MLTQPQLTLAWESPGLRGMLGRSFVKLTEHWQLSRQDEARLLGWDYKEKRTTLDSLRTGKTVLDKDEDKLERIIHLINIHKSLRLLFPYDRQAVYDWVKVKRERFGGHSALAVMLEDGSQGIAAIRYYLDYERTH